MDLKARIESLEVLTPKGNAIKESIEIPDGFIDSRAIRTTLYKVVVEYSISQRLICTYDYQVYEDLALAEMVTRSINEGLIKPLYVLPTF